MKIRLKNYIIEAQTIERVLTKSLKLHKPTIRITDILGRNIDIKVQNESIIEEILEKAHNNEKIDLREYE